MNVSLGYCEDVLKTLPVGYYLGHPVAVRLDPTGDSTYIELDCERVTIGFVNIYEACKSAPDDYNRETIIRSLFYHEISHAILTPSTLPRAEACRDSIMSRFREMIPGSKRANAKKVPNPKGIPIERLSYIMNHLHDLVNIFEDERIETMLRTYYMGVDFKRLVVLLNGDPKSFCDRDPMGRFFATVRYRHGDPGLVLQVQNLINKYRGLTNGSSAYSTLDYLIDLVWFTYQVMRTMPMQDAQDEKPMQSAQVPQQQSNDKPSDQTPEQPAQTQPQPEQQPLTDEEIEEIVKEVEPFLQSFDGESDLAKIKNLFKTASTNRKAAAVEAKVNKVLATALNKQKNLSGGSHGYAGRIDPRAVVNRDYKWFAKKNQGSAAKRFNKVRFNLFVDSSGSFCSSQSAINALICALKKIESTNPDFSVRVAHCGDGTQLTQPDDPYVECKDCSVLSIDTKAKYDSLQTPNATNVNIVVFDGRMSADDRAYDKAYGAFNHPNCIIVSDPSNEDNINQYAAQAKSVIVADDYAKVFTDIVLNQVEKLLA